MKLDEICDTWVLLSTEQGDIQVGDVAATLHVDVRPPGSCEGSLLLLVSSPRPRIHFEGPRRRACAFQAARAHGLIHKETFLERRLGPTAGRQVRQLASAEDGVLKATA